MGKKKINISSREVTNAILIESVELMWSPVQQWESINLLLGGDIISEPLVVLSMV